MTILDEIAAKTRVRVEEQKKIQSLEAVKQAAEAKAQAEKDAGTFGQFPFLKALQTEEISFICEVKKASPSKGVIAEDFPYLEIAKSYDAAGASAISVLTEPYYFQGSNQYLQEIAEAVSIPVLRKDFTVDSYMIYEAKLLGASAVLLICSLLTRDELKAYMEIAHGLGLSALVEAHTAEEVEMALASGARIIGVNNRDLKTFNVDITTSVKLREMIPAEIAYVSESGIKTPEDIAVLKQNGTNGVLIGETFMRQADKKATLDWLRGDSV